MASVAYSPCIIRFRAADGQAQREYSDRTIIELRQDTTDDYSLRAMDLQNNRQVIFDLKLNKSDMYEFGDSDNSPDKIRSNGGTFSLWLKQEARRQFHDTLKNCFELLQGVEQGSPNNASRKAPSNISKRSQGEKDVGDENVIFDDIHKLSEYIQRGDAQSAVNTVGRLIEKRVRLQNDTSKDLLNDKSFQIRVRIDSLDSNTKDKEQEIPIGVYSSTKVHELRALFEYTHDFPCEQQYYFVNGNLAHAESNMKELNVGTNSLFVLFVVQQTNVIIMSVLAYSTCRIEFTSDGDDIPSRTYSDRSTIEIRQDNNTIDCSIRAIDVENDGTEIFNIDIIHRDQYECGMFAEVADEIRDTNGTYSLWLNEESREQFHEIYRSVLQMLFPNEEEESSDPESLDEDAISFRFDEPIVISPPSNPVPSVAKPPSNPTTTQVFSPSIPIKTEVNPPPNPVNCDARDVLTNIRNLSRYIKQGNDEEAARLAKELASLNIRLQIKPSEQIQHEEEFRVLVQFDGNEYGIDQHGLTIPVEVFPSSTVRELRAVFELSYNYSPSSQYFFVNGDLAHDDSTMRELKVGPNSLFILFVITHPKKFKNTGPWNCSSCTASNQQDTLRCHLCFASRMN